MITLTSDKILKVFEKFKWKVEEFNVIGIRSNLQVPDTFNDLIGCLYKVKPLPNISVLELQKYLNLFQFSGTLIKEDGINGKQTELAIESYQSKVGTFQLYLAQGTTIPGVYWLNRLASNLGTAVLVSDKQHINIWKKGLHKGKDNHPALVQMNECEVLRDWNKNKIAGDTLRKETGHFGINCHRSNIKGKTLKIGEWSAGCQVFQEKSNLDKLLTLCETYKPKGLFTYSLINEKSI